MILSHYSPRLSASRRFFKVTASSFTLVALLALATPPARAQFALRSLGAIVKLPVAVEVEPEAVLARPVGVIGGLDSRVIEPEEEPVPPAPVVEPVDRMLFATAEPLAVEFQKPERVAPTRFADPEVYQSAIEPGTSEEGVEARTRLIDLTRAVDVPALALEKRAQIEVQGLVDLVPVSVIRQLGTLTNTCPESAVSGTRTLNLGNSYAGASGSVYGGSRWRCSSCAAPGTASSLSYLGTNVYAKLLGQQAKAFEAYGRARVLNGTADAYVRVMVGPYTLINTTQPSIVWSEFKKITLLSGKTFFWLGPVPFSLKGELAAGLEANVTLQGNATTLETKNSGKLRAWLQGSASFAIDIVIASAGLEATLRVLDSSIEAAHGVKNCKPYGHLQVCVAPVRLLLKAFAKISKPCFPDFWNNCPSKWSKTLVDTSIGSFCWKILDLPAPEPTLALFDMLSDVQFFLAR
jgi:hypothetical protein